MQWTDYKLWRSVESPGDSDPWQKTGDSHLEGLPSIYYNASLIPQLLSSDQSEVHSGEKSGLCKTAKTYALNLSWVSQLQCTAACRQLNTFFWNRCDHLGMSVLCWLTPGRLTLRNDQEAVITHPVSYLLCLSVCQGVFRASHCFSLMSIVLLFAVAWRMCSSIWDAPFC